MQKEIEAYPIYYPDDVINSAKALCYPCSWIHKYTNYKYRLRRMTIMKMKVNDEIKYIYSSEINDSTIASYYINYSIYAVLNFENVYDYVYCPNLSVDLGAKLEHDTTVFMYTPYKMFYRCRDNGKFDKSEGPKYEVSRSAMPPRSLSAPNSSKLNVRLSNVVVRSSKLFQSYSLEYSPEDLYELDLYEMGYITSELPENEEEMALMIHHIISYVLCDLSDDWIKNLLNDMIYLQMFDIIDLIEVITRRHIYIQKN